MMPDLSPMFGAVTLPYQASIAANTQIDNIFAGNQYQQAPFDGYLTVRCAGSATGLRLSILVQGVEKLGRGFVNTQNRVPIQPDDIIVANVPVRAGQQIIGRAENTTAGALTLNVIADLVPA
jgi:hypothetical protein